MTCWILEIVTKPISSSHSITHNIYVITAFNSDLKKLRKKCQAPKSFSGLKAHDMRLSKQFLEKRRKTSLEGSDIKG